MAMRATNRKKKFLVGFVMWQTNDSNLMGRSEIEQFP
jgi:hypothetical protein